MRHLTSKRNVCQTIFLFTTLIGFYHLIRTSSNSSCNANKRQRTIDFLRGASMSLIQYAYSNTTVQFPAIESQVCMIAKNGHAAVQYTSCLLAAIQSGNRQMESWLLSQSTYAGAFSATCQNRTALFAIENDNFKKYVFIRDPLDRFVSGWLYICKRHNVCLDCGLDLACFLRTLFNCWNTNMRHSEICTYDPPDLPKDFVFFHMSPQAVHCRLKDSNELQNYNVIDYSRQAVNALLLKAALRTMNDKQYERLKQLLQKTSDHAATREDADSLKRTIISDRNLASMFFVLFFIDYDTFSFDLPQFIVDFELFNPYFDAM